MEKNKENCLSWITNADASGGPCNGDAPEHLGGRSASCFFRYDIGGQAGAHACEEERTEKGRPVLPLL